MNIYSHQDKFIQNKYYRWYYSIIERALCQGRIKNKSIYYEAHHILPSSIFPEYKSFKINQWNKVLLTAREHFICHLLLTKFTTGDDYYKMLNALTMFQMCSADQHRNLSSRQFEIIRKLLSIYHSYTKSGSKNFFYKKKHTVKSRNKMKGPRPQFKTENNVNFLGVYITPLGETNKRAGFSNIIHPRSMAKYCKNNDIVVSKEAYNASCYLRNNFSSEIIGKTFKDIGFDFKWKG